MKIVIFRTSLFAAAFLFTFLIPGIFADASTKLITTSQSTSQSGVTANWSFDNSTVSGSTVSDLSGNGHNLTLVNGTYVSSGYNGQALTLDGVDDYAWGLIGSLPTSVSLSMWVKANDVSVTQSILTEEGDGAPSSGYHFTLVGIYNGRFYAGFWDIGDIASGPINAGQWYNVVLYYDGVAHSQSLYVDGVLQGTQSGTWSPPSNIYFLAGYQQQSCSFTDPSGHCGDLAHYFGGQIDDLKGYNHALSASDISSLQSQRAYIGKSNTTAASPLSSGLVGYWSLDGDATNWSTGKTADKSGQGNTGQLVSMSTTTSPVSGKVGQALNFNGANSCITTQKSLSNASAFSLAAWVNASSLGNRIGFVGQNDAIEFGFADTTHIAGWTPNGNGGNTLSYPVDSTFLNRWHYVVFSGDAGGEYLYVDGVRVASGTGSSNFGSSAYTVNIGCAVWDASGNYFAGKSDDVRIYNRALSASEVSQLYAMGQSGATIAKSNAANIGSGLMGYYTMDGSSIDWRANVMADKSGQGNTATLVSVPTTTAPVTGRIGQALKFAASGQKITSTVSTPSGSYAVSAWIRYQGATPISAIKVALAYGPGGSNGTIWMGYASDGSIAISNSAFDIKNSSISSDTKWHHMVASVSGGTLTAYVDGVSIGSTSILSRGSNALLVADYPGGGFAFPGSVDDVRVYNRPLSASEVSQLYQLGK